MGSVLSLPNNGIHAIQLIQLAAILYIVYQIWRAIYNAFLHPLSKYPGPFWSCATHLPMLKSWWAGTQPYDMRRLHDKYGHVVRITPTELSYSTAQATRDIYGHRFGGKQSFAKDPIHYGPMVPGESSIIHTTDADHTRVRKILSHSFSDKALKEQEPLLQRWADLLVTKLRQKCEEGGQGGQGVVDMVSYYNFTTFDIMADLTFSEPLYMLEGSEYSPWVRTIFGSIKAAARMRVLSRVPGLNQLLSIVLGPIAKEKQRQHHAFTDERVDRRLAKDPPHPDLWSHILRRKDQTTGGLSLPEMRSNASIFMIAGTETTATLLSGLTYLLLTNPSKMTKLLAEVRQTFRTDTDLNVEALARAKYLCACVDEALRCYPPVPTGLPRIVPPGGASICGEWVPGGTSVSVDPWSSNRSPMNFHEPDAFVPERWLPDAPEEFANDDKAASNPFSHGPRNCLGRNLAYHEARLLLAKVLWNFDLELVDPDLKWIDQSVFFLWDKPDLMIRLTPVKR